MANVSLTTHAPPAARLRDRGGVFSIVATVDDGLYSVERVLVTIALLVMSIASALNILFQFLIRLRSSWLAIQAGDAAYTSLWPAAVVLIAAFAMGTAIARATPGLKAAPQLAPAFGALFTLGSVALASLMLAAPSSLVCALLTAIIGVITIVGQLDTPRPIDTPPWSTGRILRVALAVLVTVFGVWFAAQVPEGYSWAQKISLVLLLWVSFIGASMATHDGRHLTVDAVRKAVPAHLLPWYNAASYLVAAVFTIGFAYLSFIYFERRLDETANPGEIPDWIKVAAIPFSLALVSIRFLGQSIASVLTGILIPRSATPSPAKEA